MSSVKIWPDIILAEEVFIVGIEVASDPFPCFMIIFNVTIAIK